MGPRARILLRHPLTDHDRDMIGNWLNQICASVEDGYLEEEGWDFWLENGYPVKINYRGRARRLFVSFYPNEEIIDEPEARAILRSFGFTPTFAFKLGSYLDSREDHHLLAGVTLTLAERFNGLIDYCGYLSPGRPSEKESLKARRLKGLRGQLHSINGYYQYHVSDSAFLRSWLQHPYFTMI